MSFLDKSIKPSEAYIALFIDDESIQTGIWSIEDGKTRVLSVGEQQSWGGKEISDLTESVDVSLSAAVSKIAEIGVKEPDKVILGLPNSWVKEGEIDSKRLDLLRQLSQKLALKPVGFVVNTEALVHFFKIQEGVPVSAILIGLNAQKIKIALVHLGKVLGNESVSRSENLALDVEEGLLRFPKEEVFPPRMILYGEGDFEQEKQTLVSYPWQEPERKLPFLHFPRVEVVSADFAINALCLAGGTEIAKSSELAIKKDTQEIKKEIDRDSVAKDQPETSEQPQKNLGFVVGEDVLQKTVGEIETETETESKKDHEAKQERPELIRKPEEAEPVKKGEKKGPLIGLILTNLKRLRPNLLRPKMPSFGFKPPKLVFIGLFLVVFGVLFWIYRTVPKATITVFVSREELKEELELTLDPTAVVWDEKKKTLPAQITEASVSQSKTKATTGKKTVGEKARGEVTIFNIGNSKNLAAGTVLTGSGELEFILDQAVSIASGSALGGSGQAKANITAADIGADYNLAGGSEFTLANFDKSILAAKNESALTGGTSRQIQVVSEEDRASLKKDLEGELTNKAKEEILGKIPDQKHFIEESLQTEIIQEDYDRKVSEEAQEVSLSLAVKATGLVFEESTLKNFLSLVLNDKIKDYEFRWDETELSFEVLEVNDDGSIQFVTKLAGKLYPKIDESEIIKNLAGKSFDFQKNYLSSLPKIISSDTEIVPAFFARFGRLPLLPQNIKVEIRSK